MWLLGAALLEDFEAACGLVHSNPAWVLKYRFWRLTLALCGTFNVFFIHQMTDVTADMKIPGESKTPKTTWKTGLDSWRQQSLRCLSHKREGFWDMQEGSKCQGGQISSVTSPNLLWLPGFQDCDKYFSGCWNLTVCRSFLALRDQILISLSVSYTQLKVELPQSLVYYIIDDKYHLI